MKLEDLNRAASRTASFKPLPAVPSEPEPDTTTVKPTAAELAAAVTKVGRGNSDLMSTPTKRFQPDPHSDYSEVSSLAVLEPISNR
jgi:hypothetical protein